MRAEISPARMVNDIRQIYASDLSKAEPLIEAYLEQILKELSVEEKVLVLQNLMSEFGSSETPSRDREQMEDEIFAKLFPLLLGRKVSRADLTSLELLKKLAESLNTIFDRLNELVAVINSSLLGEQLGEKTIRHVIGFHLEGADQSGTLESYLGRINRAFLVSLQAFQETAGSKVNAILQELDPGRIRAEDSGGLKFGPLRRAEFFDIYTQRFNQCKDWFESGRFAEEFMREFENRCQKLFG